MPRLIPLPTGPDRYTTLADTRTAINLANGIHPDDIDPAGGYDMSHTAYQSVRDSWTRYLNGHTPNYWDHRDLTTTRTGWAECRPDLIAEDDWATQLLNQ